MERFADVFQATFEFAPVGIAHVAPDGSFLRVNPQLCAILGRQRDELVSLRFQDITHPDDVSADEALLGETLRGERDSYAMDKRYLRSDGTEVWARLTVAVLRKSDGSPHMFVSIIDDIDGERCLERALGEALGLLESHLTHTPLAVIEWDPDGRVARWSGSAEQVFGWSAAEARGRTLEELNLIHPDDESAIEAVNESLSESGKVVSINRNLDKDGREVHCAWHNSLIELPGGGSSILSLVQDVTEQTQARAAEGKLRAELEARVEARTHELAEAVALLERSNEDLERFAYIASHDLQEPLRMVSSYTQLLADRYQGQLDEKADKFIHFAVDGAERMRQLILDLLQYSRAGRAEFDAVPVAIDHCLETALGALATRIRETGARIEREPMPRVRGSETLLAQVFQNLIGNAIKFVDHGVTPHVRIGAVPEDGGWRITVTDNGIGIDAEHAERIFEPFKRLHARTRYEGSGVGLSICVRTVERLGGRIRCEPGAGSGSCFVLWLPSAEDAGAEASGRSRAG